MVIDTEKFKSMNNHGFVGNKNYVTHRRYFYIKTAHSGQIISEAISITSFVIIELDN